MPQGTIKSFDVASQSGSLVDDALLEHAYDREAFAAAGLQELRVGQRVRFELEGDEDAPRITRLNIVSL